MIKSGTPFDLRCHDFIGFEIYYHQALSRTDQQVDYALDHNCISGNR